MISILIFTLSVIILHTNEVVFLIFRIKYCQTEVLEQPGGGPPAPNFMAVRDQRQENVSKQNTLLADVDVAPRHGAA